eukprot:474539-Prorocentrum_minimum.AAC.1
MLFSARLPILTGSTRTYGVRKESAGELIFRGTRRLNKVLTVNFAVSVKNWRENWLNKVLTVNSSPTFVLYFRLSSLSFDSRSDCPISFCDITCQGDQNLPNRIVESAAGERGDSADASPKHAKHNEHPPHRRRGRVSKLNKRPRGPNLLDNFYLGRSALLARPNERRVPKLNKRPRGPNLLDEFYRAVTRGMTIRACNLYWDPHLERSASERRLPSRRLFLSAPGAVGEREEVAQQAGGHAERQVVVDGYDGDHLCGTEQNEVRTHLQIRPLGGGSRGSAGGPQGVRRGSAGDPQG